MFTAKSIAFHYQRDILSKYSLDDVIIGGGGSHNDTLMQFIKDELYPIPVYTQDEIGYSSDAKEAVAFAILGNETLNHHYSNIKSSTGCLLYTSLEFFSDFWCSINFMTFFMYYADFLFYSFFSSL